MNRTSTVYDDANRTIAAVDPLGNRTTSVYDLANRLTAKVDPLLRRTTTVYDAASRTIASVDPLLNRTSTVYDDANRAIAVVDALNFRTTSNYDAAGQLRATVNPLNFRTTSSYDLAGRKIATQNARGYRHTTIYDAVGSVLATVNPALARTSFAYDAAARQVRTQNARGFRTTSTYLATGAIQSRIDPFGGRTTFLYDAVNRQVATRNPLDRRSTTVFDPTGKIAAVVNPLGRRTTQQYDAAGRQIATLDALLQRTSTVYDAASRPVATVNSLGHRTTSVYDAAGQRIRLVDANNRRVTFLFDAAGRDVGSIDPLGRRVTLAFDAVGNRTVKLDPRGNRLTATYDAARRLVGERWQTGKRHTYAYDAVDNQTRVVDGTGIYTTTYDSVNRASVAVSPPNQRLTYSYDAVNNRTRLIDPDNGRFTYAYDAKDRLTALVNPQNQRTSFAYDALDRQVRLVHGNGSRTTHVYDAANQLSEVRNLAAGGATINRFTYTYDAVGQRTQVVEAAGARTTWSYDAARQLRRERRAGGSGYDVTYTYDPAGNRTVQVEGTVRTTYSYDAANQLQTEVAGASRTTYSYDACGNRTQKEAPAAVTFYSWDEQNRLAEAEPPAGPVTLTYNARGRRVGKSAAAETRQFLYDFEKVLRESDGDGVPLREFTSTNELYGNLVSEFDQGQSRFFQYDGLGSTDALLNADEFATDRYTYRAFGLEAHAGTSLDQDAQLPSALAFPLGAYPVAPTTSPGTDRTFVGRQGYTHDRELDLYFVNERYYDFAAGRWVSEDRAGYPASGVNLFLYCNNDPVNQIDPSGQGYLSDAAEWAFDKILKSVNIDPETFKSLLASFGASIGQLVDRGKEIVGNLLAGGQAGFQKFTDNLKEHFKSGLAEWLGVPASLFKLLTGFSLSDVPAVVLELLGYSWDQLLQLFQDAIGADNYAILAKTADKVSSAVDQGVIEYFKAELQGLLQQAEHFTDQLRAGVGDALWGMLKAMLQQVAEVLVIGLVEKIVSLLNPAGAIYQLLKLAYKVITFFIENMQRILKLFEAAKNAFMQAVQGIDVDTIGQTVEGLLAKAVVPALSAVARLIDIDSLPRRIKEVLMTLKELAQKPAKAFLGAIGRVLAKAFDQVLGLFGLGDIKPKPLVEPGTCQARPGEDPKTRTRVWVSPQAEVMVQDRQQKKNQLNAFLQGLPNAPAQQKAGAEKAGKALSSEARKLAQALGKKQTTTDVKANKATREQVVKLQKDLQDRVCPLLGEESGDGMGGMGMACPVPQKGKGTPPKRPLGLGPVKGLVPVAANLPRPRGQAAPPPAAPEPPAPPPPMAPMPPMIVTQGVCECSCGYVSAGSAQPPIPLTVSAHSCFGRGTATLTGDDGVRDIDRLQVGSDRMAELTDRERGDSPRPPDTWIEPEQWRLVRLWREDADGCTGKVTRLFRVEELAAQQAEVGASLWLDLEHVGVRGDFQVMAIEPCPEIAASGGRRVLGTFEFNQGKVYDLVVEGEPQPLRVTGPHPVRSADRQTWIAVHDLRVGERLQAQDGGTPRLVSLTLRADLEPVYNIEVDGDHCYRVGQQGLLVHNASALERLTPTHANPTHVSALSPNERAFRDRVFADQTHIWVYRAQSGTGLGDFVLFHMGYGPGRARAIAIELENPANYTNTDHGVVVNFVFTDNAGQVWASELAMLNPSRIVNPAVPGCEMTPEIDRPAGEAELRASNLFTGVLWVDMNPYQAAPRQPSIRRGLFDRLNERFRHL